MTATGVAIYVMVAMALAAPAAAAPPGLGADLGLEEKVLELQLRLDAQEEARERQADAFEAAASRIEIVNGALVGLITLAGVLGALLAIRWVRQLAHRQIAAQVETAIDRKGDEVFATDSAELREEYDEKFATLYRRYNQLVDEAQ